MSCKYCFFCNRTLLKITSISYECVSCYPQLFYYINFIDESLKEISFYINFISPGDWINVLILVKTQMNSELSVIITSNVDYFILQLHNNDALDFIAQGLQNIEQRIRNSLIFI